MRLGRMDRQQLLRALRDKGVVEQKLIALGVGVALSIPALALAAPTVAITLPTAGSVIRGRVDIYAKVTPGASVLTSIEASVGGLTTKLTPDNLGQYWGTIDLTAAPWGPQPIVVTASDGAGAAGSAATAVVHDELPKVALEVGRATYVPRRMHVRAVCTDDGPAGCATFELGVGPQQLWDPALATVVASSTTGVIDQTLDLSAFAGQQIRFYYNILDSAGQGVARPWTSRPSIVTDAPPFCVYAATRAGDVDVQPVGAVLDADEDRILYDDEILDRHTGIATRLPNAWSPNPDLRPDTGALISGGALVWSQRLGTTNYARIVLPNGNAGASSPDVRVRGPVSIFGRYAGLGTAGESWVRPIALDTATVQDGTSWRLYPPSLAALPSINPRTGEICKWSGSQIILRQGESISRTISLSGLAKVLDCASDAGNVVYRFTTPSAPGPANHVALAMVDKNNVTTTLVPEIYSGAPSRAGWGRGYDVAGEWVVYFANNQIFRRDPSGTVAPISPVPPLGGSSPLVLAMRSDGDLVLFDPVESVLHEVPPGTAMSPSTLLGRAPFSDVEDANSIVRWRNGRWVIVDRGGSAFLHNPGPMYPFACSPDAAPAGDAGADASAREDASGSGVVGGASDAGGLSGGGPTTRESPTGSPQTGDGSPTSGGPTGAGLAGGGVSCATGGAAGGVGSPIAFVVSAAALIIRLIRRRRGHPRRR